MVCTCYFPVTVPHDTASECVKPSLVPRVQPLNPLDDEVITLFMIATDKETGKTILEDGTLHHIRMYSVCMEGRQLCGTIFIYVMNS